MKIFDNMKAFFSRTITKIIAILMIPSIIVLVFAISNNYIHLRHHESLIVSKYTNEMNSFLNQTEATMTSIINAMRFISANSDINSALSYTEKPSQYTVTDTIASIRQAKNLYNIIDSIAIYNRNADFVLTSNGVYDSNIYFDNIYPNDKYSYSFWSTYRPSTRDIQLLQPITIKNSTSTYTSTIVPLVYIPLDFDNFNSFIIVNVSMNKLFKIFELYRLTPNSKIYMIDNSTGNIYYDNSFTFTDHLDYEFNNKIRKSLQSDANNVHIGGKKHLLIQSSTRSNSWGYTYLISVPYSDINSASYGILLIVILFVLILFVCLVLFIFFGSKMLYLPWSKIAAVASAAGMQEYSSKSDVSEYITDTIMRISDSNENLKEDLTKTLPLSQEKYLIDILNDNVVINESENILDSLSFKYEYFVAIAISINLSHTFVSENLHTTQNSIRKKLQKSISTFFSANYITYILPSSNNTLYLLLNVEDDCMDNIRQTIASLQELLKIDADNLNLSLGTGNIYKGIDGLKLTHQEALMNLIKHQSSSKIQFSAIENKSIFSAHSENILINYLTAGLTDKASEMLNNIFEMISDYTISEKQQIYSDILSALKRVMRHKGLISASVSGKIEMLQNNPDIPNQDMQQQLMEFCDIITEHMQLSYKKVDIKEIISYINEHYTENLMLEELAEKYGTSAKYLSKRIKQYLDMSFKDYLSNLKINKAKELLASSDITISELYEQLGFQTRVAFTRSFKVKTGLSPSEYKKNCKNQAKE